MSFVTDLTGFKNAVSAYALLIKNKFALMIPSTEKGALNGVAPLVDGLVPDQYLANYQTAVVVNANIATSLATAKTYAEGLVVGLWDDRGNFDASVNTFPGAGGSGAGGAILKGDIWTVSVAGTAGGVPVAVRQTLRAMIDAPGQVTNNWAIGLANADIDNSITQGITGRAPSQDAVYQALVAAANASNLSAGTLPAARLPAFGGDATSVAGSSALTLATVNANVGTFGANNSIPSFAVNAKGLITSVNSIVPSGTWDINISGSAASAATAGTATNAAQLTGVQQTNPVLGSQTSMSMSQDGGATRGSFVAKSTGVGDANLAGMVFWNDVYAIKLGVRSDGYFGLGGWSRTAWSWYSDPSGNMVAAGNVSAYSDPRLKDNVVVLENALDICDAMDGVCFTWNNRSKLVANPGKRDIGLLANQVKQVLPMLVTPSIKDDETDEIYDTVDYAKMVPILLEAIKALRTEVNLLKRS